jgi:hypothetical protein
VVPTKSKSCETTEGPTGVDHVPATEPMLNDPAAVIFPQDTAPVPTLTADAVIAPREETPAVRAPVPAFIELLEVLMVVQERAPEDVKEATEAAPAVRVFAPAFKAPEVVMAPSEATPAVRCPVPALMELLLVVMAQLNEPMEYVPEVICEAGRLGMLAVERTPVRLEAAPLVAMAERPVTAETLIDPAGKEKLEDTVMLEA